MLPYDGTTAPVALIFFNRPGPLARTFATIRDAQPRELFLIQDGPRSGNQADERKVRECREIVSAIDWECTVHRDFAEQNLGTGRRVASGLTLAFSTVDRLIILEDDCVPAQDFFPFCTELLDRYKDDQRVGMITGMNHLGAYDGTSFDYLFSRVGSIAGWATWKRTWTSVDQDLEFLDDPYAIRLIRDYLKRRKTGTGLLKRGEKLKARIEAGERLTSWSYPLGVGDILHSRLIIVPRVNLMSNIGVGPDGANTTDSLKKVPRASRFLYDLPLHEFHGHLKHPQYVTEDLSYNRQVDKLMGRTFWGGKGRKVESLVRRIMYGENPAPILRRWVRRLRANSPARRTGRKS